MHTFLSLSSVDSQSDVERQVSALLERLKAAYDSIESCHISVEQLRSDDGARYWRIVLLLRVLEENVRVTTSQPSGPKPAQSFAYALEDTYTQAIAQIALITARRNGHGSRSERGIAADSERCA